MKHQAAAALLLLFVILPVFSGCSGGAPAPTTKPIVQILVPAYGASFIEGELVSVQAVAADAAGIARAELFVDGQLANTKLSQNPQGEQQFNVVMEWVASRLGAHTLTVRAFNTAGGSGETAIPIAVNPPLGAPTLVAVQNTPIVENTPVLDATAAPPDIPTVIPLPPTDAPNGTEPAPTDVSPTAALPTVALPTATLPPIPFHGPSDGGMQVQVDWSEQGLRIGAFANDSRVGQENGDGIAYVEFFIQDLKGNVIASKRENNAPYCFFGENGDECTAAEEGTNAFVWRSGVPIREGFYFIRAVSHTPDERIQVAERFLRLNMPPDSFENIFVTIVEPFTERIEQSVTFEADVSGGGIDSGIERVEMYIVQYDGKIVHARTERSPRYCGFSGGDNNQPCPPFAFSENGSKWSSGTPIYPTQYVLRAIAYLNDGSIAGTSSIVQIDRVE